MVCVLVRNTKKHGFYRQYTCKAFHKETVENGFGPLKNVWDTFPSAHLPLNSALYFSYPNPSRTASLSPSPPLSRPCEANGEHLYV